MVEHGKEFANSRAFNTILSGLAAGGTVFGTMAVLMGWITIGNNNSKDILVLQSQMSALSVQIQALSGKIDQGPRADQMTEILRHLSAIDGRLDTDERTQSRDEKDIQHAQDGVDAINRASDARLQGHVR